MDALNLFVTSPKINWNITLKSIDLFREEANPKIPFKDFSGTQEICRYEKELKGISLFVTPVFRQALIGFKSCFETDRNLDNYKGLVKQITADFGQPVYAIKEQWKGPDLMGYPCNIWILPDAILEVGIHEDNFVALGYVLLTKKDKYKEIYTPGYLSVIGWKPPKTL